MLVEIGEMSILKVVGISDNCLRWNRRFVRSICGGVKPQNTSRMTNFVHEQRNVVTCYVCVWIFGGVWGRLFLDVLGKTTQCLETIFVPNPRGESRRIRMLRTFSVLLLLCLYSLLLACTNIWVPKNECTGVG